MFFLYVSRDVQKWIFGCFCPPPKENPCQFFSFLRRQNFCYPSFFSDHRKMAFIRNFCRNSAEIGIYSRNFRKLKKMGFLMQNGKNLGKKGPTLAKLARKSLILFVFICIKLSTHILSQILKYHYISSCPNY